MAKTDRGFDVYTEFEDTRGAAIRVQESSEAGVRRVWIFANGGRTLGQKQREMAEACAVIGYRMPGNDIVNDHVGAHLTPAQAHRVARALLWFADGAR